MGEIFMELLNRSIMAGWLILVVLGIRLIFRRMPKWVNCLLWGMVALRLIVPFSIESVFSLQPSAEPIKVSTMVAGEAVDSDLPLVENSLNPMIAEAFSYQASESAAPLQIVLGVAGTIWLLGMILLLVWAMGSMVQLHMTVREAVLYQSNVYLGDGVQSPFILGVIRPRIYLPSALNETEIAYIMAHEQAHLRRGDHLWKPIGYLLLCIYWFNPLCILAYIMLCKDIEFACDEKVIKNMSFADKKEYSRVLVSCATQRRLILACPLAFGEVGVKERVKSVLHYKKPAFWITAIAILGCIVLAICFLTNPEADASEVQNPPEENSITEQDVISGQGTITEQNTASQESVTAKGNTASEDMDAYAFLEMDYAGKVMLTTDLTYDAGTGEQATIVCDVHYTVNGVTKNLGTIMSYGTAYPISYTNDGIFAASGHAIEKYAISEDGTLYLAKGIRETFDETGDVTYTCIMDGVERESTAAEYQEMLEEHAASRTVHFGYTDEEAVNGYHKVEETVSLPEEYAAGVEATPENAVTPIKQIDTPTIASIVAINGNTGERKVLTAEDTYYLYHDLLKLYRQLNFSADAEANERIGYQYCMQLKDADGNKLQSVTPYKDGLTVDHVFYQYEDTGDDAAASLRLMEYLEYVFD